MTQQSRNTGLKDSTVMLEVDLSANQRNLTKNRNAFFSSFFSKFRSLGQSRVLS